MPDSLVTVTAYSVADEARAAKGTLDTAGIEAVVDESVELKTKVRVENVDAIRAGDVLTARFSSATEIDEPDEEPSPTICPSCQSPDISSSRRGQMFAAIAAIAIAIGAAGGMHEALVLIVGVAAIFLLIRGSRQCNECGETWN